MYTNEQLIEFCQEAVRIPSYSGQEKGVAEFMKRKMAACSAPSTANAPARRS